MRVLHLVKTSVGATWAYRQIRELIQLGVEVHVVLPPGGPMEGQYALTGATEHLLQTDFPISSPWKFPALAASLSALIQEVRPDIIHSHFVGTTLSLRLILGRGKTIPRIFQVPGPLHLEHALFRNAEVALAGNSDYWIGTCQWTCDRYGQSGIDRKRIFLSYYGTDVDLFTPRQQGRLRSELGLGPDCQIIGMVAYMYAPKRFLGQTRGLKGHEDLIDAFKLCLENNPNIRCVIVGGAWDNATKYEAAVRKYARLRCGDRVIFLGTRHDVPDIYPDFDVAVHPSHSENVGGAVESCLLGIPTIATRVGGFPDLVRDGETGWLVSPANPQQLAETIVAVLHDPSQAKVLAIRGKALAKDLFDVKRCAVEIADIYQTILSRNMSRL